MSAVPAEITDLVAILAAFSDQIRLELNHRSITGRRYRRDCLDIDDAELEKDLAWYSERIEMLLAPYENDD